MATISDILGKGLVTLTYTKNGRDIEETFLLKDSYRSAINERIPHKITTNSGTTLYGLIELPIYPGKYFATISRAEYDSLYEYYITHKSELEQKAKDKKTIQEQTDNWFEYRNPRKSRQQVKREKEKYEPFICYSSGFETNRRKH